MPDPNTNSALRTGPTVIGIYGISGSGKTFLMDQLEKDVQKHPELSVTFYEGSQVIDSIVPGGLQAFTAAETDDQTQWRQRAIDFVKEQAEQTGKTAVVAGHLMFWDAQNEITKAAYTEHDLQTYTHILYLDVPPDVVFQRRCNDQKKDRPVISQDHLRRWQDDEKTELRKICRNRCILLMCLNGETMRRRGPEILADFAIHSEHYNLSRAEQRMDDIVQVRHGRRETVLVFDADRTLTPNDTGMDFWVKAKQQALTNDDDTLKKLFSGPLGYSYSAFRQATLLYEEAFDNDAFDSLCRNVAFETSLYTEILCLLRFVSSSPSLHAMIITCGVRRIWELILQREGLAHQVAVIGGGRLRDSLVVTSEVKKALVARLQNLYQVPVWAFGDSPLDVPMLRQADQAVVVVGDERTRSQSMEGSLIDAIIEDESFRVRQTVLSLNASPLLDSEKMPLVDLTQREFVAQLLTTTCHQPKLRVIDATEKGASKLLMTPMRDSRYQGPRLREAHRKAGAYLATEYLTTLVGLETYPVPHVQGHDVDGYRLSHEQRTLIVALMRGGEPIASGINDVFPSAGFLHVRQPADITKAHIKGLVTIFLVDSVVNSGKTVVEFLRHIRNLQATIRVIVVAGVVQVESVSLKGLIGQLGQEQNVDIVTLRLSQNKFTGTGVTDTGNRLFNTTDLL
jgi:uracil phosphoribosyltransferase/phosphoserine phosphatase/adenylate kinase